MSCSRVYVNTLEEIEELRAKFRYIYVDVNRNRLPGEGTPANDADRLAAELRALCGQPKRDNVYKDSVPVEMAHPMPARGLMAWMHDSPWGVRHGNRAAAG